MNGFPYQCQQPAPQPPVGGISVPKLLLIGSVISLVGGLIVTASTVIAYNNSLQKCAPSYPTQVQINCKTAM